MKEHMWTEDLTKLSFNVALFRPDPLHVQLRKGDIRLEEDGLGVPDEMHERRGVRNYKCN